MANRMRLPDAAKHVGLSEYSLRQMVKAGRIPAFKVGSRFILDVDQVEDILNRRALENVKEDEADIVTGKIRRIESN